MSIINGMSTVNGGTIMQGLSGPIEVLGPGYSNHPKNQICTYTMDNSTKVVINYWGNDVAVVFRFRSANDLQHYWSRTFNIFDTRTRYHKAIVDAVNEYSYIFNKH